MLSRCGPDAGAALTYYTASAERGDPWGQFNLARLLVAADRLPEALAWLDRALGCHLSGFHAAVADALAEAPHPELRRRAARARALAAAPAARAAQDR